MFKNIIKKISPPVLYDYARKLKNQLVANLNHPEWFVIEDGIIKDYYIYVPPSFNEMIKGTYDNFFWEHLRGIDLESQTILDVGGHIGYHSLCFAKLSGGKGNIFIFEPNPYNIERMKLIFNKNSTIADSIHIVNSALANYDGSIVFHFSPNVDDKTSSGGFVENSYKPLEDVAYQNANFISTEVTVNTLDNFTKKNKLKNIKLIKIDVEGAEHLVLQGGSEMIKEFKPIILMEVHNVSAMLFVSRTLIALNYEFKIINQDGPSRCFLYAKPA